MYCSVSFDRCIQLWNCHYSQDPEQLQSVQKHPPYSLILVPPYSLIPFPLSQPLAPSEWFSGPIVLLLQDGHITGNIPVPSIYLSGHAAGLGILVPRPGMKRGPLQCRHGVLAAGPQGGPRVWLWASHWAQDACAWSAVVCSFSLRSSCPEYGCPAVWPPTGREAFGLFPVLGSFR